MMIRALLLSLFLLASANVSAERVELPVGATRYQGGLSADGAIAHFLGVPYAAPPVGELRWRSPKPPVTPTGPVDATRFAPACYQGMHIVDWYRGVVRGFGGDPATVIAPEFSEDCLYLNAWTPSLGDSQLRPVMVYVHGGSNKGGWAYEPNYVGEMLARKGVVVVSVAYRLGALGFFSHPDLAESNFALQDLAAALHWVRDNVAAFGGEVRPRMEERSEGRHSGGPRAFFLRLLGTDHDRVTEVQPTGFLCVHRAKNCVQLAPGREELRHHDLRRGTTL